MFNVLHEEHTKEQFYCYIYTHPIHYLVGQYTYSYEVLSSSIITTHFKVVQCLSLLQEEHLRVFWREMLSFTVLCTVRVATSSPPPHSTPTPVEPPLAFAGLTSPIKHTQNSPSAQVYAVMNNDVIHPLHLQTLVSRPHLILDHSFLSCYKQMSEVTCEACHLHTINCSGLRLVRLKQMHHCTITSDLLQVFVIACVPCTQMISTCLLHVTS